MPSPTYEACLRTLAETLHESCDEALHVVIIDGLPASGKSTLTLRVVEYLRALGRSAASMENDWFIDRQIRNPVAIAKGLAVALAPLGHGAVEERLLRRFLDQSRLAAFRAELARARFALEAGQEATLYPQGAFWNLRYPPAWSSTEAARGITLSPGAILLIEGTLTRAVWQPHEPDLRSVLIKVPVEVARSRFLGRNKQRRTMRNRAFTALAYHDLAFSLAQKLLQRKRNEYTWMLDLEDLASPVLSPGGRIR